MSLLFAGALSAQTSDAVRINQLGFYPDGPKKAVIVSDSGGKFFIKSTGRDKTYYAGDLSAAQIWQPLGLKVSIADFSSLQRREAN